MKDLCLLLLSLVLVSCGDYECVTISRPEMIGEWVHLSANHGFHYIRIQENGRGYLWGENDHGNTQDTQKRGWYIKDDVLYFSRFQNKVDEEQFTIDQYPEVAELDIYLEFDTIPAGVDYMILNGREYQLNSR